MELSPSLIYTPSIFISISRLTISSLLNIFLLSLISNVILNLSYLPKKHFLFDLNLKCNK